MKEKSPEIPQKELTATEAIRILKDVEIQLPLITITDLGKAIRYGIEALEIHKLARQETREIFGEIERIFGINRKRMITDGDGNEIGVNAIIQIEPFEYDAWVDFKAKFPNPPATEAKETNE